MSTKPPRLAITDSALVALQLMIERERSFSPVATVVWSIGGTTGRLDQFGKEHIQNDGPRWEVGFFDREVTPVDRNTSIRGVDFVFDQGAISERLNGAVLDYRDGAFVIERATT